jgi:hypothetical protein
MFTNRPAGRVTPGQRQIPASTLNRLLALADQFQRLAVAAGGTVRRNLAGFVFGQPVRAGCWARVLGEAGSGEAGSGEAGSGEAAGSGLGHRGELPLGYPWEELRERPDGTLDPLPHGRGGDGEINPLYVAGGGTLEAGDVVWVWLATPGTYWLCQAGLNGAGAGSGGNCVEVLVNAECVQGSGSGDDSLRLTTVILRGDFEISDTPCGDTGSDTGSGDSGSGHDTPCGDGIVCPPGTHCVGGKCVGTGDVTIGL